MSNSSVTESSTGEDISDLIPFADNAIFRDSENHDDNHFLPDILNPLLPPYPNPSRYPSSLYNSSNSTFETLLHFTPSFTNVLIMIGLALFTIWVLVMNLLIIGALWKGHRRDKDHITDMYLINLAFTDVLLGIFVFPFMSIVILIGYFPLSPVWCNIWVYFDYYLIIASSYGFAALMCSYLLMLRWPEYYPRSTKLHFVIVVLIWIFSNAPWTAPFFHDRVSFIYPRGICGFSIEKNRFFTFYIGFTGFYIPLAIALVAGIFAVKHLKESSRAPLFKLLLQADSCHVHPFVPASASDSEFNDLYNDRRENGVGQSQSKSEKSRRAGFVPSEHPSGSTERSKFPKARKRHSLISVRTFQQNAALQNSVRKHFPLVATSLILFVVCRSPFYTYFGIGSVVPKLFPPDLSHSVYWVMHSYALLAPVVHLLLDADLRRSVIRFVNEGTFQPPSEAVATNDKLTQKHQFDHGMPAVSVIDATRHHHRNNYGYGDGEVGRSKKNIHYV